MPGRLSDVERAERTLTEEQFLRQVVDLAVTYGWEWMHVRPGLKRNGKWWTATIGSMHAWPDLTLVRRRDFRLLFVELKREKDQTRPERLAAQERVRELLDGLAVNIEVYVWRPSDLRGTEGGEIGYILS